MRRTLGAASSASRTGSRTADRGVCRDQSPFRRSRPFKRRPPMKVGVLASHEATTLQSLLDACLGGRIQGSVAIVVSNNGNSGALRRARRAGVQAVHASSKTHEDPSALDAAIRDVLVAADVGVVFLAGYMKKLGPLVRGAFEGKILNTHPALLPRYGGPGMYGDRVFEAVLEAGETESGVSIHLVEAEYDVGTIVCQCRVPVLQDDSAPRSEGSRAGTREGIRGRNVRANRARPTARGSPAGVARRSRGPR